MAASTDNVAIDSFATKDVAEDTDTHSPREEESALWGWPHPFWAFMRVCGVALFTFALGLIVYGLFFQKPNVAAAVEKDAHAVIVGMELTAKPRDEVRNFEFATLPNGVQVLTVQDKRALTQAFATGVEAGSFDNPKGLEGLAHFCEHMEFLGTKKYPGGTGFDQFMAAHGGGNNAFTSEEMTVYYAHVTPEAATEGFDRFADFFRAPTFDPKYVDKEIHAVDSEHVKNIHNRYNQVVAVFTHWLWKAAP